MSSNPVNLETEMTGTSLVPRDRKRKQGTKPKNSSGTPLITKDQIEGDVELRRGVFRRLKNALKGKLP